MEPTENVTRIERNPDLTRQRILDAAFMEIYRNGFQGMRLDDVLAVTGLTKGALYHHFPNKRALGYAVVDEVILPMIEAMWLQPLKNAADPLQGLITVVEQLPDNKPPEVIQYGCPVNNLAQEMSPLDEGFRQRLDYIFRLWHDVTEQALERARQQGRVRDDVNCDETATFILAAVEGCIGIAKNAQSKERLRSCNRGLVGYLRSLEI
ncbi:MAG: TetR/AcrR family transcriptional regulator [Thiogranum sp.]|jgi:AcrR family transcriptional regulator|nr:TetR/AcrR family transcriptional regulator [Thiogranum sp.]